MNTNFLPMHVRRRLESDTSPTHASLLTDTDLFHCQGCRNLPSATNTDRYCLQPGYLGTTQGVPGKYLPVGTAVYPQLTP